MSDQIKVSKIEIKIGKQVISLTPDELKELKLVLEVTFPTKEVTRWIPGQPIIIDRPIYPSEPNWPWKRWDTTWCGGSSNDLEQTVCMTLNKSN